MCVSRVQRLMTSAILGLVLLFHFFGYGNTALWLQVFVIIMILVWAITNFCPSLWVLKKFLLPCSWDK